MTDLEEQLSMRLMTREGLTSLKKRALRRCVWFGILTKIERCTLELTIKCVKKVRSARLALVISRIVCKILKAFRSRFLDRVERAGYDLAERTSRIAVDWGYIEASGWKRDLGFVRCLGVNAVNAIPSCKQV